jgi:hypothetical protein
MFDKCNNKNGKGCSHWHERIAAKPSEAFTAAMERISASKKPVSKGKKKKHTKS